MKSTKTLYPLLILLLLGLSSCGVPMSYFTTSVRTRLEAKSIPVDKLQFYVDTNVELRRELASGETSVASGKVRVENGKSIHIIKLRRLTPGVCVGSKEGKLDVSFEVGEGKFLTFGVKTDAGPNQIYQIEVDEWVKNPNGWQSTQGKISYDGETYYIQPAGGQAKLMIQKSVVTKLDVDRRVMKGRKLE